MRNYFSTLRFWWVDVIACCIVACVVTPPDPMTAYVAFAILLPLWLTIRYFIAKRLHASSQEPGTSAARFDENPPT